MKEDLELAERLFNLYQVAIGFPNMEEEAEKLLVAFKASINRITQHKQET